MFQIAIDTDTMPVSPAVYADEYRGRALPTVLPLVQGFRGNLRVYFLGEHAPSENAAVALYLRALQSKEKLVQTGLGTRGISDAGNVYYDVPLAADTTALSAVLGNRENVIMRAGIVANDVTSSPQTNFEWQLNIAVSASAIGTGEKPPVSPNAIEEHNNDVAAHPFILQKIAAAEVDVSGLRTSIAGVSESLNATNTNLNNAKSELSTEISEVSAALAAETIARENEDAELRAALTEEQGARSEADSELRAAIDAEASERSEEDSELRSAIESETSERKSENSELRAAIDAETSERSEADSELGNKVSEEITVEATARENADDELRAAISAETTARSEAVSEVVSTLETEISTRSEADVNLGNLIAMETSCRAAADSEIEGRINSEKNCRTAADNALRGSINTLNSDVAAIEMNIQTLENKADAFSEHTVCSDLHWRVDGENNLIRKEVVDGKGLAIVSADGFSCFGIFLMPTCGSFLPKGSSIRLSKNGCIAINSTSSFNVSLSSGSGSIFLSDSGISLSSHTGISLSFGSEYISLSGSGISLSSGFVPISLSGSGILLKGCHGGRIDICGACVYVNGVKIST